MNDYTRKVLENQLEDLRDRLDWQRADLVIAEQKADRVRDAIKLTQERIEDLEATLAE